MGKWDLLYDHQNRDIRIERVKGVKKLKDHIIKLLLFEKGRDVLFPDYGITYEGIIGEKFHPGILTKIEERIISSLVSFRKYQEELGVEEESLLRSIKDLEIFPNPKDPREIIVNFKVENELGEEEGISLGVLI